MTTDYVVIGAGSAGCAIAYRLAEAGKTVTVIEHGGSDIGLLIQMPGALSFPMNMSQYDWGYKTEPEPHLGGRRLACPRGKVIGGSSSINGMVYVRGHARDFDHWRDVGADGWGYADVLPYFKRMESWDPAGHGGDPEWRGTDGPLHVTRGRRENPLSKPLFRRGANADTRSQTITTVNNKKGLAPLNIRSTKEIGGHRPRPICDRRWRVVGPNWCVVSWKRSSSKMAVRPALPCAVEKRSGQMPKSFCPPDP